MIVPDGDWNADGEWITIEVPTPIPETTQWRTVHRHLSPHVPRGYHFVSYECA